MTTRREWLVGEIARWEREGIVPSALAARLRGLYPEEARTVPMAMMVFVGIGALLLGCGVIALLAANWDMFPRSARTFLSFLPLALCGALALVATRRGWTARLLWEPLGLLWAIAACTGVLMISQIYQVTSDLPAFVLVCALITLPVVYLSRATVPFALWPSLAALFVTILDDDAPGTGIAVFWTLLALLVPAVIHYWRCTSSVAGRVIVQSGLLVGLAWGGVAGIIRLHEALPWEAGRATLTGSFSVAAFFALLFLAGRHLRLKVLAGVGLFALVALAMVVVPYEGMLDETFGSAKPWVPGWTTVPQFAYACVIVVAAAVFAVLNVRRDGAKPVLLYALMPLFVVTAVPLGLVDKAPSFTVPMLIGVTMLVAFGVGTLVQGLRTGRLLVVNAGTLLLLYAILAKFFAGDISFTVKGAVMTVLGAAILTMNLVWAARRRRTVRTAVGTEKEADHE